MCAITQRKHCYLPFFFILADIILDDIIYFFDVLENRLNCIVPDSD